VAMNILSEISLLNTNLFSICLGGKTIKWKITGNKRIKKAK